MQLLKITSSLSTLLLIIFYIIFSKRNKDKKFWVIFLYCLCSLILDILIHLSKFQPYKFFLYSFFTLIEYTSFSYFLLLTYKEKSYKWLLILCTILFYMVMLYSIVHEPNGEFDNLTSSIAGLLVIIFCILFFYEQLQDTKTNFIYSSKSFWIVSGCLIYTSTTLFLFVSVGLFKLSNNQEESVWMLNNFINVIKNILFGIAFYKLPPTLVDSLSDKSKDSLTGSAKAFNQYL